MSEESTLSDYQQRKADFLAALKAAENSGQRLEFNYEVDPSFYLGEYYPMLVSATSYNNGAHNAFKNFRSDSSIIPKKAVALVNIQFTPSPNEDKMDTVVSATALIPK